VVAYVVMLTMVEILYQDKKDRSGDGRLDRAIFNPRSCISRSYPRQFFCIAKSGTRSFAPKDIWYEMIQHDDAVLISPGPLHHENTLWYHGMISEA
jgi:hypothetical protein